MEKVNITFGSQSWQQAASIFIRMNVFVLEGKISLQDEFDLKDNDEAVYAVAYQGDLPVSTARLLKIDDEDVQITRVATLKEYRGNHLSSEILKQLEDYSKTRGYKKIIIHSEVVALAFYLKCGYEISSNVYYEDGKSCQSVEKYL
ncbi:GNAT family N-acetyltransferase [Tetragenococcus halophilus]|uniref:N-acetyltransferase n=1 Tax=Tetragenococcus halophilus TaxID=51669 RepID=A0A3G5FFN7_TETHA|nr:GNAT family N-acetyltransferase [Tetragenococcus halophilus]MDN5810636.1 GNAT family N-acetyltransferase [Tetragenococcus koreensis]AYW49164.1 N-acetyltransferase [Tetragenococcus halophilus]MCO8287550.1 GNAT family N-acetyltransferase [Tetragenococcus halophilus]MCO8288199.1 GNAT family N-acetyltransferase [Tetragenococcus halophilus]MDN5832112.1 GNAT family N-acetyltransferase [Tetragenococcus halophilus]